MAGEGGAILFFREVLCLAGAGWGPKKKIGDLYPKLSDVKILFSYSTLGLGH